MNARVLKTYERKQTILKVSVVYIYFNIINIAEDHQMMHFTQSILEMIFH